MSAQKALSQKDMGSNKIVNLADGTAAQDAATKAMLDALQAFATSRANHTGSQLASTVSNFDTAVRTSRLDQMAAPTGQVAFNGQQATGLADPGSAQAAATKAYVDSALASLVSGQTLKGTVRVASSAAVTIASPGANIDAVAMAAGDVFLATAQAAPAENGPWTWNGAAVAATRPANFDSSAEAVLGSYWLVREGTKADSFALMTNDAVVVLGTTALAFTFISVAGAAIGRYTITCPSTAAGAAWTITHNLGSLDVHCIIRRSASPYDVVDVYIEHATVNTCVVRADVALAAAEFTAIVKY